MAVPRSLTRGLRYLSSISHPTRHLLPPSRPLFKCLNTPSSSVAPRTPQRFFISTPVRSHGHIHPPKPGEELYITIIDKTSKPHRIAVCEGDNILDIAQAHDLEMEGACGGSCACSTCHVIVDENEFYERIPEPTDDENDMLDLAFGLTETSRLGCQIVMKKELDGLVVKLPGMTRNLQASDFKGGNT